MSSVPLMMFVLVMSACIGIALVGVVAYLVGRRGRRTDDHPLCRKCGFDLTGRPDTSERCPECGRDVTTPAAIVVGHRTRRRGFAFAGLLLIFIGVVAMTLSSITMGTRVDWNAAQPTWWLLYRAGSDDRLTRDPALDALTARSMAGELSPSQEASLIDRVLAVQADAAKPWNARWADIVARRIEEGTLAPVKRDAFIKNMFNAVSLALRPDICIGDPLPLELRIDPVRGPSTSRLSVAFSDLDIETFIDGVPLPKRTTGSSSSRSSLWQSRVSDWIRIDAKRLGNLVPGSHVAEQRTLARVRASFDSDADLVVVPVSAKASFTVHPAGTKLVKWIEDESMRPAMEAALKTITLELTGETNANVEVDATHSQLPMPVSFKVTIRQGEQIIPAGTFATAAKLTHSGLGMSRGALQLGKADVIFTPDDSAAAGTIGVDRAWKGEIVIRDVPVTSRK